jgi:hypothetical protein
MNHEWKYLRRVILPKKAEDSFRVLNRLATERTSKDRQRSMSVFIVPVGQNSALIASQVHGHLDTKKPLSR